MNADVENSPNCIRPARSTKMRGDMPGSDRVGSKSCVSRARVPHCGRGRTICRRGPGCGCRNGTRRPGTSWTEACISTNRSTNRSTTRSTSPQTLAGPRQSARGTFRLRRRAEASGYRQKGVVVKTSNCVKAVEQMKLQSARRLPLSSPRRRPTPTPTRRSEDAANHGTHALMCRTLPAGTAPPCPAGQIGVADRGQRAAAGAPSVCSTRRNRDNPARPLRLARARLVPLCTAHAALARSPQDADQRALGV
jgi:hypothetical protein